MKLTASEKIIQLEKELTNFREQYASLEGMFEMTTTHLKNLKDELSTSQQKLLSTNKSITDSINYAKRIQNAFNIKMENLNRIFPNSFIFEQPKDIVSGDFVWAHNTDKSSIIAVGDCTGHGVPGAMLSVFMISMLNQIIKQHNNSSPADILIELDKLILTYLSQYNNQVKDSAELSIIKLDKKNSKLLFSAANRPLIHIRKGNLTVYGGAKYVLGNSDNRIDSICNHEINAKKDDLFFIFSDGFADQFGGELNKKFLSKRLLTLLQSVSDLTIKEQLEKIKSTFTAWMGNNDQIDDVLIVGIRI